MIAWFLFALPTAPLGLPLPLFTPASGEAICTFLIRALALALGFGSSFPTSSARAPARSSGALRAFAMVFFTFSLAPVSSAYSSVGSTGSWLG